MTLLVGDALFVACTSLLACCFDDVWKNYWRMVAVVDEMRVIISLFV